MNPFLEHYNTDENDKVLIEKAVKGNKKALEDLLRKHQPYIYNIAWKMVHQPADAQDVTQEVMVKVITNLSKFEGRSEFRTWIYRIAVNHMLQMKLKSREEVVKDGFDVFANRLASFPDQELTELEQQEKAAEIREMNLSCMSAMLLCLSREQRIVYVLGELFNADHTVGAEILNISKGNFRQRLSRARKDLLSFMNNKCGLVNKSNPCRCHKKVTAVVEGKVIDAKHLLFNREEYSNFKNRISKDPDEVLEIAEEKYRSFHQRFPFKEEFDKKSFLNDLISDERILHIFNLN